MGPETAVSAAGSSAISGASVSWLSVLTIFRLSKAGFRCLAARDRALPHIAEFAPDVQHRSHHFFVLHPHRTEHGDLGGQSAGKRQGQPDQSQFLHRRMGLFESYAHLYAARQLLEKM